MSTKCRLCPLACPFRMAIHRLRVGEYLNVQAQVGIPQKTYCSSQRPGRFVPVLVGSPRGSEISLPADRRAGRAVSIPHAGPQRIGVSTYSLWDKCPMDRRLTLRPDALMACRGLNLSLVQRPSEVVPSTTTAPVILRSGATKNLHLCRGNLAERARFVAPFGRSE